MPKVIQNEETRCFKQNKPQKKTLMKEVSNLPDKEFKEAIIIMPTKLERRMEELTDNFNKDLENIKNQSKVKNTITEKLH